VSAFDPLREFTTAPHIRDSEACGVIARDLRAAVAEHDALRDAVRGYLATLPEEDIDPRCSIVGCGLAATRYARWPASRVGPAGGRFICLVHAPAFDPAEPLPEHMVTLRALAALAGPR
jgi:hypothetical protein